MKKKKYPICSKPNSDNCFGRCINEPNNCYILENTNFKGHECPFYKTTTEFIEGQKKYGTGQNYIANHTTNK